jgi:hypothetical protein
MLYATEDVPAYIIKMDGMSSVSGVPAG